MMDTNTEAPRQSAAFVSQVKNINHMIYDLTHSKEHLLRVKAGCNIAMLTIGDKTLTVTPRNLSLILCRMQRMQREFDGTIMIASIILDLLAQPRS